MARPYHPGEGAEEESLVWTVAAGRAHEDSEGESESFFQPGQSTARSYESESEGEELTTTRSYQDLGSSREVRFSARVETTDHGHETARDWRAPPAGCRRGAALLAGVAVFVTALYWRDKIVMGREATRDSASALPARRLLESPDVVDMVVEEVHDVQGGGVSRAALRSGVRLLLGAFGAVVDENLDDSSRAALQNVELGAAQWRDLGRTLRALRDKRLQGLGHQMLQQVRNSTGAPDEVWLKEELLARAGELNELREEFMPTSISQAQVQGLNFSIQLWSGMLSPRAVQEMRRESKPAIAQRAIATRRFGVEMGAVESHVRYLVEQGAAAGPAAAAGHVLHQLRRLNAMPESASSSAPAGGKSWTSTELTGLQLSVSITAVVLVLALEILILLSLTTEDFTLPTWGWLMIACPTEGTAVATCYFGLSVWCDVVLGALGLNLLMLTAYPIT